MYTFFSSERLLKILVLVLFLIMVLLSGRSFSQGYPNRPLTVVVPWGAGGSTDVVARAICKVAEKEFGQPIIVENKAGASGVIGMNYVLKSQPDGYTIVITTTSAYLIQPHIHKVPYNPITDITDITTIYQGDFALLVRSDSPLKTYEDVVKYAKQNPEKFSYATAGVANTQHIVMERVSMKEGIKLTQIPFKSGAEAVTACLGGHTDGVAEMSPDVLPYVRAGKLRFILSLNDYRWKSAPDVPSLRDKGMADFAATSFVCVLGPKGLPEPIIQKVADTFNKAKKDPAFVKVMDQYSAETSDMSGKEYGLFWRSKYDAMGKVLEALGLTKK